MSRVLEIDWGWPPSEVWPNARPHHLALAAARRQYRGDCKLATLVSLGRWRPTRRWRSAQMVVLAYHRRSGPPPDVENVKAALKSAVDSLQDAGLLADDRNANISRVLLRRVPEGQRPRIHVWLKEE